MGLFDKFKKKREEASVFVLLHLNARLQPIHRGEFFEDMFEEVFSQYDVGEIVGGGTLQEKTGEINSCDIEMDIKESKLEHFMAFLRKIDTIPKGSWVEIDEKKTEIGAAEGLGIYLNGTDLPEEVYSSCDINELIGEFDSALEGIGTRLSHWEGSRETALYFYGTGYEEMKTRIETVAKQNSLCEKCRIVRIA